MELRIKKIHNAGDIRSEYIEMFVNAPINLKNFIVSDTCYSQSSKCEDKHIFWFPDLNVNTGTFIKLNSRQGINENAGYINLYWNLKYALWKDRFATAYVIKIEDYIVFPDAKRYLDTLFSSD